MTLTAQKSDLAKVQALITAGNDKIAALDAGLRDDIRQARIAAIRDETMTAIASVRLELHKRQSTAAAALPGWTQDAARRRAKFSDDPATDAQQRLATMKMLEKTPTQGLFNYLSDAIRTNNLAWAEAVRVEFASREGITPETRADFHREFGAVVDHEAAKMETELQQTAGIAAYGEVLIHEFARGRSDPIGRMGAARDAGLVTPRPLPPREGQAA